MAPKQKCGGGDTIPARHHIIGEEAQMECVCLYYLETIEI